MQEDVAYFCQIWHMQLIATRNFTTNQKHMIQRIQSVYLVIAAICSISALFTPFVYFENPVNDVILHAFHYTDIDGVMLPEIGNTASIGILFIISAVFSIYSIFLYKKRTLQMRVCIYNFIINLGALLQIYLYSRAVGQEDVTITIKFGSVIPIITSIILLLAAWSIRKDELLVKSLDRLR